MGSVNENATSAVCEWALNRQEAERARDADVEA